MKIIDPNSPFLQTMGKLSDIVFCNIMFVIFSLPIFTIGASAAALFNCMQKMIEDKEDDLVARDFWRAFKVNFKQATVIWLLSLVVIGILVAFFVITNSMLDYLGRMYLLPFFLIVFLFWCGFQYVFAVQARYQLRIRDVIKNAWLLSLAALPWTVAAILVTVLALFLTFKMMSLNMCLFVWAVFGFGIVFYLNSLLFRLAFRKLDPALPQQSRKAAEGALFVDEMHQEGREHMPQISTYSDPDWNRQEYPLSDRKDVKGKSQGLNWFRNKK